MYSLLSGLWKAATAKVQYQVLILGLDHAGKTTFKEQVERVFSGDSRPLDSKRVAPTVGLNIGKIEVGRVKLLFWDLGGQEGMRVIWENYYAEAHAIIYLVDAADEKRMLEAMDELKSVMKHKGAEQAPLLVLANKQDKKSALKEQEVSGKVSQTLGQLQRAVRVMGISALKQTNLKEAISWLLEAIPKCPRTKAIKLDSI